MAFWGRPPGEVPQPLDQQIPGQDQNTAHAMLPGVPAREFQGNNMGNNVDAVHENHDELDLDELQPLQGMMDGEDENMMQLENQYPPNQQPQNQQNWQQYLNRQEQQSPRTTSEEIAPQTSKGVRNALTNT